VSDVLDIGCGTGALSLPLARRGALVLAVDVSVAMTTALRAEADANGLDNLSTIAVPAEALELRRESFDAIVSNYVLHHLRDEDKASLVQSAAGWLRPGGRLVIGDMMFGRGATARDRRIIVDKLSILARKGPGGWWRIAKNAVRFLFRLQERPLPIETWIALLEDAGFVNVVAAPVVAEAAVVVGVRPNRPLG
jgi:SAM-dependent methyltransferase